ncbi:MAG: cell division ATP-binding protein FtsE [Candidatus Wallbacteria bacterium]|nr:cell division ATP-binding protein FtsE [Candidatus Wallbacteria bacterium]
MIQMYNVNKVYPNGVKALNTIDIHIARGEFVFLVGPSGAGKTTLMRLIFRDELPSTGHVIVDGRNIERLQASKVPYLRRSIGVVFQDFRLLENRSVFDNVAFALRVTGTPYEEIQERTNSVLDLLGLSHKKQFTPLQLSGGEKQRVCIARAIVNNPSILLTDEPTGNLDPDMSLEIMDILAEINKRGTTLVVATHNTQIVNKLQKRVIGLVDGRITSDRAKGVYNY